MVAKKDRHELLHQFTAAIFAFITLVHAGRLIYQAPASIGAWNIPLWFSVIAALVSGSLAILLFKTK